MNSYLRPVLKRARQSALLCGAALAATVFAPSAAAQGDKPSAMDLQKQLVAAKAELNGLRSELLKPISVNDQEIPVERMQRELVFLVGAQYVAAKQAEFMTLEWRDQQIADGRPASDFEIDDAEVLKELDTLLAQVRSDPKTRGIDIWDAVRAQYGVDRDQFLVQRRQTILFDRVFMPGKPSDWPTITVEAIKSSAGENGEEFWQNLLKSVEQSPTGELPAMWIQFCRNWIQTSLKDWSEIRFPADGLPADVCLQVNERQLKTADAFKNIQDSVYLQELQKSVNEVVMREILRQELVKKDAYISDEDFRNAFIEYRKQFDDTIFNTEVVATRFKLYPSLEAFRARWRLMESYRRMIADEFTDENLQAHANEFNEFFGNGKVDMDVIPFLARDILTSAWLPNGMAEARQRAEAAMKEIEGGAEFDALLRDRGEFFQRDKQKGRLGAKTLNQLRQEFRESEFLDLLNGYSAATHAFYNGRPGEVIGPLRASDGYYVIRINTRIPAPGRTSIKDERMGEIVRQDYLAHRFLLWANEVLTKAEIR